MLQKIETFSGREARWRDWPVVFRAAAGAAIPGLGAKLQKIELEPNEVLNVDMEPDEADRSSQLYFMLVLVCRDRALDVVIIAGEQEGYEAWRQLAFEVRRQGENWVCRTIGGHPRLGLQRRPGAAPGGIRA